MWTWQISALNHSSNCWPNTKTDNDGHAANNDVSMMNKKRISLYFLISRCSVFHWVVKNAREMPMQLCNEWKSGTKLVILVCVRNFILQRKFLASFFCFFLRFRINPINALRIVPLITVSVYSHMRQIWYANYLSTGVEWEWTWNPKSCCFLDTI